MRSPIPVRPSQIDVHNAGSAVEVPYFSRSRQLAEVLPASARYRVDDLTNSRAILGWTAITPTAVRGEVIVPASLNAMYGDSSAYELRQVIFEFTDDDDNVKQELAYYELARVYQGATS